MFDLRFDHLLELACSPTVVWALLAAGFALLAAALLLLMLTRFGQAHPLRGGLILSLFSHMLLGAAVSTVQVGASAVRPYIDDMQVRLASDGTPPGAVSGDQTGSVGGAPARPWDRFLMEPIVGESAPVALSERPLAPQPVSIERPANDLTPFHELGTAGQSVPPAEVNTPERIAAGPPKTPAADSTRPAEAIEAQQAQRQDSPEIKVAAPSSAERPATVTDARPASAEPSLSGISSSLLSPPTNVPRLSETPVTPDPESSLLQSPDNPGRGSKPAARDDAPGLVTIERPVDAPLRSAATSIDSIVRRSTSPDAADTALPDLGPQITPPLVSANRRGNVEHEVPDIYKLRVAPDRAGVAQRQGGTHETEAAVNAALRWLVAHQSRDGRWDASQYGAGREDKVLGHDRQGAGTKADTGMTGLALLAFLGAGHTHIDGLHQDSVTSGLEFLLRSQAADGNLAGQAELYAAMYSHGMAAIALSEAYGLTHDERLERPLRRAIAYTLAAQHPTAGGWRYRPGDRQGDTSQLGWQLMALKSAKLAGIEIPARAEEGMVRFLKSVSAGQHGGLASYRPAERPSATMTAEALVCRNFLGMPADSPAAAKEAGDLILKELPGQGRANLYYWYYATLAMHQLQGDHWQQWNMALRKALVESQRLDGPDAGSWDTNTVWGGYGGRVYTTAMGALCLEVYYRFLPLYERPNEIQPQ